MWPTLRQQLGGRLVRLPAGSGGARTRTTPPPTPIPFDRCHHFEAFGQHILCCACLARAQCWRTARKRERSESCPGVALPLQDALSSRRFGHTLVLGIFAGRATFLCVRCGCYCTSKVGGLGRRCGVRPPTHGPQCIRRFLRGLHPDHKKDIRGDVFYRVLDEGLQEFTPGG